MKIKIVVAVIILLVVSKIVFFRPAKPVHKKVYLFVKDEISKYLDSLEELPENLNFRGKKLKLNYTLDKELTKYMKKLLLRHRSDYTSIVLVDNDNGHILSAIDYTKKGKKFGSLLSFSSTNPAASIFKIVTASELIENSEVDLNSEFEYKGRSTTLYKYQLKDLKNRKWIRNTSFKKAFATSNNVVFGKAAIDNLSSDGLLNMAEKFGFNQNLVDELSIGISNLKVPTNQYNLAELASGFNRTTLISPLHASLLSQVIANEGKMIKPSILVSVEQDNKVIWKNDLDVQKVLSKESSKKIAEMMELTVRKGTARSIFRRMKRRLKDKLFIGGKTGTISGGLPYGKRDWFVFYAKPKDGSSKGISGAIMIVNVKKWFVKSTFLAKNIIEYYYRGNKKVGMN